MYTNTQKQSSSFSPVSTQKKSNNFDASRSFSVQHQPDINSSPESERPSYSRNAADALIANVMRSMEVREQGEEATEHKEQSKQGLLSVAEVVMPKPELPIVPAGLMAQSLGERGIQRQYSECQQEQEQRLEEGKDSDEMSLRVGIQTKLTVGAPGDKYEQEADRVAGQVMRMSVPASLSPQEQRFGEENNPVQMWLLAQSITPLVHRRVDEQVQMRALVQRAFRGGRNEASGDLESRLNASKGGGSALSEDVRAFMEPRFGADFSSVRVHTGGEAVQMNRELSAQAFTHGSDVYFGAGKSPGNNELTAHELTHVVQQTGRVQRQRSQTEVANWEVKSDGRGGRTRSDTSNLNREKKGYLPAQIPRMCSECEKETQALDQEKFIQPKLAISQVGESRVQTDRPGERRFGPEGWYLEAEPPSPIIWQGTEFTVRLRHDQGFPGSALVWRDPVFGIIDSRGHEYSNELESTNDYPLRYVPHFESPGRWHIYFRGRTYVEGGGGFPDQLGPLIERRYTVEVAPRVDRPVLERTEDLERQDEAALQSPDTNRGQLINSFQRLAIRRALQVLSTNKAEAIRLRDIYDDPGSDTLPRVAQARQFYPVYAQLRERRESFVDQANRPRPSAAVCARIGYCEGEWQENRRAAQDNLRRVASAINAIEQQYPELHASHHYRQEEATSTLVFSEITHVALRQLERDIDDTRYRLVTNDINILELRSFINTLLESASPEVRSVIQELRDEQASRDLGINILLCGLSLALLFVPGGAFISAALGATVGVTQAASSWERSDDTNTCSRGGVTGGLCTQEEADEARSTAIWDTIFAVADIVDFVGEAADVIRAVRGTRAARVADAAHEGTSVLDEPIDSARRADSSHTGTSRRTGEATSEATETVPDRRTVTDDPNPRSTSEPAGETNEAIEETSERRTRRGASSADDVYEEARRVEMFGHEQTPDGLHEVEAYRHGIGRCSSTPGQFCPLIPNVYEPVLRRRPRANAQLISLQGQIRRFTQQGQEVPQTLLDRVAHLEMRLRNLEEVDRISSVPRTYRIEEVTHTSYRMIADVVPDPGVVLEFPDGTRVWRDSPGGPIRHESTLGEGVGRQHFELEHYSATEHGRRPAGPRYERSHTLGQGTGFESPYGIYDAPAFVNQELQNRGIEGYMRQLAETAPEGTFYRVTTSTAPIPDTRRLGEISYRVEIVVDGQIHPFFEYRIRVSGPAEHPQILAAPITFANNPIAQMHRQRVGIPDILQQPVNHTF